MPTDNSDSFKIIELQEARARIERMLPSLADRRRELADALGDLAEICGELGETLAALSYRRRQLAMVQEFDNTLLEAIVLLDTARAAADVGEQWEAEQLFRRSAERYRSLGDSFGQGTALLALAESRFSWGDTEGAARAVETAAPLIRGTSAWTEQAEQLYQLSGTLRFAAEVGDGIMRLRTGKIDDLLTLGRTLAGHADGVGQGIGRLAQNIVSMLNHVADLPRAASQSPELTAPEQAAQDTRSVEELIAALQDADQKQRRIAALALGLRRDPAAVEPLVAAARDRSQWVRMAAVVSLGKLKDRRAFEVLAERLREDRDKDVRRSAATALRPLKDPRAAEVLTLALIDDDKVAESAAKTLRTLKLAPRVDVLVDLLRTEKNETQRALIAIKIGEIGDTSAVESLLAIAENRAEDGWLRLNAFEAANKLGDRRVADAALRILTVYTPRTEFDFSATSDGAHGLVCTACQVVARFGDASMTPTLLALLEDGSPQIRHAAIVALGAVADVSVVERLQELQQTDTASVPVDEPLRLGGMYMAGMRQIALRTAAADAVRRIQRRGNQS